MPTDSIQLQIVKNGGAPATGAIEAAFSDSIVLGLGSSSHGIKKVKYRIYEFPAGFPCPAGWSAERANCYAVTVVNGGDAPAFSLPASDNSQRGKYFFDAVGNDKKVNGSVVGTLRSKAQLKIPFLNPDLEDIGFGETNEFDGDRQYVSALKKMVRAVDTVALSDITAIPAPSLVATSNIALTGIVTVDGVASNTVSGDILCTAQSTSSQNGYWTPNASGAWTRPSYYNSDALVAATLGKLSGAALLGTLNKGKSFYALSGSTLAGAKVWLPGKAPSVINVNEAPWFLRGDSSDEGPASGNSPGMVALFDYYRTTSSKGTLEFGDGHYLTSVPIVKPRYVSVRGTGRQATEIGTYGTALIDTFKLSEILNVGGGDHATFKHIKISNSTGGYQPQPRVNGGVYTVGLRVRSALPGLQILECAVAGTAGAHPPIGELSPINPANGMVLTGTANADKQPMVIVRTGGYLGTMSFHLTTDNGATIDSVHTTSLTNADGTYRDFETATFPSSGTLGVKLCARSALAAGVYGASTLTSSFVQPSVGANRQIAISATDTNGVDGINTTRLLSTGFCWINGGGLYSLVSIDSALLATVKLVTAVAAPGATVAISWVGQAYYPAPRVEVLGTPPADDWAIDIALTSVQAKLGTATFRQSSRAIAHVNRNKSQQIQLEVATITPTAGAYYDYTDPVSEAANPGHGLVIRFHTGIYTPTGGYQYTTPTSVCSMVVGSKIADGSGTLVWDVKEGPEAVRLNGRGFVTFDDVQIDGGMTGAFICQSEGVTFHDVIFNACLSAGSHGTNGDGRLGEYGGFTNNITYSGQCFWYTGGYGISHDGGNSLAIEGAVGFQSCPYGSMRLAAIAGGKASGFYAESSGPVYAGDCTAFTRRPVPFALNGFSFSGFFTGALVGPSAFDMWTSKGVSWSGGEFGGTVGIVNAGTVSNGSLKGCEHIYDLPQTDGPFSTGVQIDRGVETKCVLEIEVPNAQVLANGVNDLAAPAISEIDLSGPSAAFSIRSAPIGKNGQRVTYRYFGVQPLTLSHNDSTPTAATRLLCQNARDIVLPPAPSGGYVEFTLRYRTGSINRWVVENVSAIKSQPFTWKGASAPATTSTRYATFAFGTPLAVELAGTYVVGVPTVISALTFLCQGTALATDTVTVTLRKNGADTAITFTIPAGTTPGTVVGDYAHSVAFAPGDTISIKLVQSGSTAQSGWEPMFQAA